VFAGRELVFLHYVLHGATHDVNAAGTQDTRPESRLMTIGQRERSLERVAKAIVKGFELDLAVQIVRTLR